MGIGVKGSGYYNPVPGSRNLSTAASGATKALKTLEGASQNAPVEVDFEGERLSAGSLAPDYNSLYDSVMPGLEPIEQALLGHLYRMSADKGADWVRTGKKELMKRTGLSDRRLLKALAGLANKGIIKPLHRNTSGTLYKMYTVYKKWGGDSTQTAETKPLKTSQIPSPREKPLESPINEEAFQTSGKVVTIRKIAEIFFERAGKKPSEVDMDSALAQITYLLEDGFSREEALKTAIFLAENFGKKADISKLPYYVHQAINR